MKDLIFPILLALLPALIQKADDLLKFDSNALEDGSDKVLKVSGNLLLKLSDGKLTPEEKKAWFSENSQDIKDVFRLLAEYAFEALARKFK